ncbi:hypothetical protein [Streptomyces sp. NRRL S-350]|uniref:hypothetical protein n=1 Tax=Streptomyces sp. NRRL S-350 TaxID=1463902 RepID=UPI0004C2090C|nr:hypothetical protein [Streptomyces sp. NRRL S-350]
MTNVTSPFGPPKVYGHGRTLKAARENTEEGLALVGVPAKVTITAVTPELEHLRSAEAAYEAALGEAVAALLPRRATLRAIARATGVPASRVKRILAGRSAPYEDPKPRRSGTAGAGRSHAERIGGRADGSRGAAREAGALRRPTGRPRVRWLPPRCTVDPW